MQFPEHESADNSELSTERGWQDEANCLGVDANLFYPERGDHAAVMAAKAICAGCPVTAQCLEESAGEKDGIFGGMSGRQRREYFKVHGVGRACLQCGERFTARNVQHLRQAA